METSLLSLRIGVLFYLAAVFEGWAQDVSQASLAQSSAASVPAQVQSITQNQSLLQAFQQQEQALMQSRQALIAQGATQDQLTAWRQQNAAGFATLQQLAQGLASGSALQIRPTNIQANIPANASPALINFLTTQANLANAKAQIHNQLVQAMPSNATADQVSQMLQQEQQLMQQEHAADFQLQGLRAQTLAAESAPTSPPAFPFLQVPTNATPQLAAYLTQRYQLIKSRMQVRTQYANSDPATLASALQQWQQQNAAAIQQVQQLAQNLSQADTTIQN